MRQTTMGLSFLAGFLLCGNAFAVDSQLMNLVMPDAKVLAGVNVTSAISSPLGQFLITKITANGQLPQSPLAGTGFSPLQDVTEILAATAADPSNPGGLVLMRGNFPVDQLSTLATGNANWQISTYGGASLFTATNSKGKIAAAFAFPSNSILIAGDLASVKAAIDRSSGANSIDPALAVIVNQLSGSEDSWLASAASVASLIPSKATSGAPTTGPVAQVLPLLQSIQSFNGGVKFGETVALTGQLVENNPQNAGALTAVIKLGLLMVGSLSSNQSGNKELASLIQLLQTMQVTTDGANVNLSLSVPEAQIESLIDSIPATSGNAKAKPASLRTK